MVGAQVKAHPGKQAAARPTVLVVEDEVLVRMCIAEELRGAGYAVIEAANAREAMDVLGHDSVDVNLVFSDIRMVGSMDGVSLARAIRAAYPIIKIVLTSSHLAELSPVEHDGFFPKPYRTDEVIRHIKALTGQDHARDVDR
jgi:CheY-like chemotaxis protein